MTIKLYGNRGTRALRCYWVLEELEVPYEVQTIDFRAGDHRTPEYLKINPNGKVLKSLNTGESGNIELSFPYFHASTLFSKYGNKIFFLTILLYIFLTLIFKRLKI